MGAGKSRHTVAAFRVDDIEDVVGSPRERGPDGNILAVESVA